jgi:hypothetical protein
MLRQPGASGSFTPEVNSPLPYSGLSCRTAFSRSPAQELGVPIDRLRVLDTMYFYPAKEEGINPVEVLDRVTMQVFVRGYCTRSQHPSNVTSMEYRRVASEYLSA